MDFHHQKQELLERANRLEEKAFCEKNTQAKDIMRTLATLYREMAEELEDSALFERRSAKYWISVTLCSMVSTRRSDSYQALNGRLRTR
jgi:hypothetical protein